MALQESLPITNHKVRMLPRASHACFDWMKNYCSLSGSVGTGDYSRLKEKNGGRKPSKEERKIQVMGTRFQRTDSTDHKMET